MRAASRDKGKGRTTCRWKSRFSTMATSSSNSSFLVLGRDCGRTRRVLTLGFLILGGTYPVLVDTGYRSNQIMETLGMRGLQYHENMIENQLAKHGVRMGDVRFVAPYPSAYRPCRQGRPLPDEHDRVINRRELEYSVSGMMHPQYPAPDIKHLIDRLHTKGALRFLDLEITGPVELIPGVYCEAANAHTEGSMNVHVQTAEGIATICGDVIYDINDQIVEPFHQIHDAEPQTTGNHGMSKRAKRGRSRSCSAVRAFSCRCTTAPPRSRAAPSWRGCRIRFPGRSCSASPGATGSRCEAADA